MQQKQFISKDMLLPNIMSDRSLDESDQLIEKELKALFDIVWHSANCRESPYYNEIGEKKINRYKGSNIHSLSSTY